MVSSAPRFAPSNSNCTPATPTLSEAFAVTVIVPLIVVPFAGEVMLTVGGVVSLDTVTVTAADGAVLPAASRATAVKVCEPLPAVVVSQETEYGAVVSSPPRLAPSSLNWTPTTPTLSDAFAVTLTVPPTVAPFAGDVMLTAGGLLSTVTVTAEDVAVLPAASRATTVRVCEPLVAVVVFHETAYGAVVSSAPRLAPSSLNCTPTTPTLSEAFAVTLIVELTASPSAGNVMLTAGGPLSTVTVTAEEVAVLPAASRATAVKVCEPLLAVVVFHETAYGAVVSSAPRLAPSSLNWTPTTPTLSEAFAVTLIVELTAAPFAGDVMLTVGGVVSLKTVTVTGSDVHRRPNLSLATAVSVCEPLLAVVVFQDTEYGAVVSSAPRLAPSSLNWTPATVIEPIMLTSALTVVVPLTVDPDVGEEMVTTRLPSCAKAGSGDIQKHERTKRN